MSDQKKKVIGNRTLLIIILILLLLLAVVGIYYKTTNVVAPVIVLHNQDSLNDQIARLKTESSLKDSAISKRARQMTIDSSKIIVAMNVFKNKYLRAIKTAPDTCKSYIDTVYKECNKVDSLKNIQLLKKDSTISDQRKIIDNKDLVEYKKNQIIDTKNDSLKIMNALYIKYRNKFRWAKGIGWVKTGASGYLGYKAGKIFP